MAATAATLKDFSLSRMGIHCSGMILVNSTTGSLYSEIPVYASGQVLCYLPNVVGYLRIGLLLAACAITGTKWPHVTFALFLLNFALDALDGYLARRFSQVALSCACPFQYLNS